jgi:glutamate-ammonia-ligase adenylyltransferase
MAKITQTQSSVTEVPTGVAFRDPGAAARGLARIRARLAKEAFDAFSHLLASSPDPDAVVVQFDRLLDAAPHCLTEDLARRPNLIHYAMLVFGHSAWLGETLIQNSDLLRELGSEGGLERSFSREEFQGEFTRIQTQTPALDLAESLARFKKRQYVRILVRDMLGIAGLAETTEETSALSDALLDEALSAVQAELQGQFGIAQRTDEGGRFHTSRFAIVSLGKLGGNELNYSSDIDLLFLYDGAQEPLGTAIANREYLIRLAQRIIELLSRRTKEGQTFRIDLRLRPQGHEGEIAVPLPRAIQYYSEVAQDWELQAMIKARHSAGDASLTREFTRAIAPYVYRPNVNFAAVKTALQSRERIDKRGRKTAPDARTPRAVNVKLDRGGIRDIEFLVQCLQRVYGGEEGWLRSRGTLFALQKLHDKEHISGKDFHNLTKAYEFLRQLEHLLQLRHGRQSHQLPAAEHELNALAKCTNGGDSLPIPPQEFVQQVEGRMAAVSEIYRRIVYQEQSQQFIDPEGNLRLQVQVPPSAENSYSQIMQRLAMDSPRLLASITRLDLSQHARRNVDRFLSSAATSSERYGAILRSPEAVEHALKLFEYSEFLTDILVRHPADIAWLQELEDEPEVQSPELFPGSAELATDIPDPVLAYLAQSSVDRKHALALFRQQFRQEMLVANARGLFRPETVYHTLRANSGAVDAALGYALAVADPPSGFAVMALGRLGSREFDVLSDADVLFVADGSAPLDAARRAAERIIEILTAYTRVGALFPVDTRLRPRGREGELVTTPTQLAEYFLRDASAWEAITYLRLRFIAGDKALAKLAVESTQAGIATAAQRATFDGELNSMRRRLEASDASANLKTGPGGTYDIDYLVGRLQAKHALWSDGNLSERVRVVENYGSLAQDDARELATNAEFLRALEHCIRLVTGRPGKWLPVQEHAAECVTKLMSERPLYTSGTSLTDTATEVVHRTREICQKYPF